MANRRMETVSYRPFRPEANLADGLLAVAREGGDLERRVAQGLARLADEFGRQADRAAERAGFLAGRRDAMENAPEAATVTGGQVTETRVAGGQGGVRVTVPPAEIRSIIVDAAIRNGVDPNHLTEIAGIESNFNPSARNPRSSAGGLFQFLDGTARQYGLTDRYDPAQASDAAARLMRDNAAHLRRALGREPNAGELYLAHQQGAGGAARLLSNPGARAVDVVGRNSVLLNGGSEDMTAGQFAARWTARAGGSGAGYTALPSAASVGPVTVTPVREPVTIEPGRAGTWRPSGRDTVYGRAYDVSGTRTYLEMLDLAMEENQSAIYEAYRDDPAMLEKALEEGLTADLRDNVFEEISPDYTVAYRKRANGLLSKARTAARQREEERNRMDFLGRVEELENRKSQRLAGFDPADPEAASDLAGLQASIDAHWDSAVARGIVDLPDAEKYKRASRSDLTVNFYTHQLRGRSAGEIATMREAMARDYAAGKLAGVSAEDWEKIERATAGEARAAQARDELAEKALRQRGDEIVKKFTRGQAVAPGDLTRFQLDAGTAPNGQDIVQSTLARSRVADALTKLPISQVEAQLEKLLRGDSDAISPDDLDYARELIRDFRKELQTDPLGRAEAIGLIPPVAGIPLDGTASVEQIREAVRARRGAAETVARHFGVPVRYFRPGEADTIMGAALENPDALVVFTQSVADAFGPEAGRALAEFSESGPALAHAAGLAIGTGDIGVTREVAGALAARQRGETPKLTPEVNRSIGTFGSSALSGVFLTDTKTQNAALQTAQLLFEQEAQRRGVDPAEIKVENSPAQALYLRVLDRALGGRVIDGVEYGGIGEARGRKIVVPPDMPKNRPSELLYGLTDEQLKALPPIRSGSGYPVTAHVIRRDGKLVSAGDGLYLVALGDPDGDAPRWLVGENGEPWRLDIRALAQVPGGVGDVLRDAARRLLRRPESEE